MKLIKTNDHQYKLGSNQHVKRLKVSRQTKRFLDLRAKTWISILIVILVAGIIGTPAYLLGESQRQEQMFAGSFRAYAHEVPHFQKPTPSPVPTKKDTIYSAKHGDIIFRIWNNETSMGKATDPTGINVICAKKGESNEFGFNPFNKQCFSTFKNSVEIVNQWFDKCLDKHSLQACLEIYSGNSKQYVNSFLNK